MVLLQREIIDTISKWAESHDKPITLQELTNEIGDRSPVTVRASAEILCKKGYLRRGCTSYLSTYILIRKPI